MSNQRLQIDIGANIKEFTSAMNTVQQRLNQVANGVQKIGKTMSVALTAPLVAFGVKSVQAFNKQAQAEQQLLVALGNREDVQNRLIQQAQALQKETLFGDEETIKAQALIAAFVDEEDAIKRVIPLVQDMAQAKGMNLAGAADLVSKTLGSSTNAMSRYGIEVTGAVGSTERLESLTKGLEKAFGGTAKAAALAGTGGLTQLKNAFGDIQEEVGRIIADSLVPLAKRLKKFFENVQTLPEETKRKIVAFAGVLAAIGPVLVTLSIAIKSLAVVFGLLSSPITLTILGFAAISLGIKYIIENWEALKARFTDLSWWKNTILDMAAFFARYAPGMLGGQGEAVALGLEAMKTNIEDAYPPLQTMGEFFSNTADQMGDFVKSLLDIDLRFRNFGAGVNKQVITPLRDSVVPQIVKVKQEFSGATEAALSFMKSTGEGLLELRELLLGFTQGLTSSIGNAIVGVQNLGDAFKALVRQLIASGIAKLLMGFLTGGLSFGGSTIFGKEGTGILGKILPNMFGSGAPVSLGASLPQLSGANVTVDGQFVLKGTDLVGSITRTQNSILR